MIVNAEVHPNCTPANKHENTQKNAKNNNLFFLLKVKSFLFTEKQKNTQYQTLFFVNFGDDCWRQAEAWIVLLVGEVEVNALAQGALRKFTQWLWIEHPTFQLGGGHFTTELLPPQISHCKQGGPVSTFTLPGVTFRTPAPVSYATAHNNTQYVLRGSIESAEWPTIGPRPTVCRPLAYNVIGWITWFRILVEKRWVFVGQLWCKIHWISQLQATNTISHDCTPWKSAILLLYSEITQHRSTTVAYLTWMHGHEPFCFAILNVKPRPI